MPVKQGCGHQTRRTSSPAGAKETPSERIWTLIRLRDQLALTAAAYDAHGIDGDRATLLAS